MGLQGEIRNLVQTNVRTLNLFAGELSFPGRFPYKMKFFLLSIAFAYNVSHDHSREKSLLFLDGMESGTKWKWPTVKLWQRCRRLAFGNLLQFLLYLQVSLNVVKNLKHKEKIDFKSHERVWYRSSKSRRMLCMSLQLGCLFYYLLKSFYLILLHFESSGWMNFSIKSLALKTAFL